MKIFAHRLTQEKALIYDLRATLNEQERYFIVRIPPAKQAVFLKLVAGDAGFCLENCGDILHRGWGAPPEHLKAQLREQYGMYSAMDSVG